MKAQKRLNRDKAIEKKLTKDVKQFKAKSHAQQKLVTDLKVPKKKFVTTQQAVKINARKNIHPGDPRYTTSAGAVQFQPSTPYVDKGIPVNPTLNVKAIIGVAAAMVSKALAKGFYDPANPTDPINAAQFICDYLCSSANNSSPITNDVPATLGIHGQAISPTRAGVNNQAFDFSFTGLIDAPFVSDQNYGPNNSGGIINYGIITETPGEFGLPLIGVNTSSGTASDRSSAFNRMVQHLNNTSDEAEKLRLKPITEAEANFVRRSGSAFACPTITMGHAFGGTGGDIVRLGNETPIKITPLAVYATPATSFATSGRSPNFNDSRGGGAMESVLLTEHFDAYSLAKVTRPVFKFINVADLFYIYAQTMCRAMDLYFHTPEWLTVMEIRAGTSSGQMLAMRPGVTMTEAFLAFRNVIMTAASGTQWGVQSMTPSDTTSENFTGFSCAVGTTPTNGVSLFMSSYLQENIRALLVRETKTKLGEYRWYIPVFGNYASFLQSYSESDFVIHIPTGAGDQTFNLFEQSSPSKAKKDKREKEKQPLPKGSPNVRLPPPVIVEEPILGLVNTLTVGVNDGYTSQGYLEISNQAFLARVTNALNKSLDNVSDYIQLKSNFGTAPACADLVQIGSTMFLTVGSDSNVSGYAKNYTIKQINYAYSPDQDIVESFPMVTPIRIVSVNETNVFPEINVISSTNCESYYTRSTHVTSNLNYRDYLDSIVELGVGKGASNITRRLQRLADAGKGGIASDLFNIFGPVAGQMAQTLVPMAVKGLDSVLPF